MVGFRAGGVDFASHLLGYEAKFFAAVLFVVHGVAEVVDVFGKAYFFLGDVEFFEVVDEFLLEPVGVDFLDGRFAEVAVDAFFGGVDAFGLVLWDAVEFLFYQVDVLDKVFLQYVAFLLAEAVDVGHGVGNGAGNGLPFAVGEVGVLGGLPYVGYAQDGVEEVMYMDQPTQVTYKILPAQYAAALVDAAKASNFTEGLFFDVKQVNTRADEEEEVKQPEFIILDADKDANIDENGLVTFTVLPVNVASAQFAATDIPVEFNAVFGWETLTLTLGWFNVDVPILGYDDELVYPVVNVDDLEAYQSRYAYAASLRFVNQDIDLPTDPASEEYNEVASTYNVLFPAVSDKFELGVYKPVEDEEGNTKLVAVGEEWQKLPYTSLREATEDYAACVGEPKNQSLLRERMSP